MDIVLDYCDHYFLSPYVYPSSWQPDDPYRQILSLLVIANLGGYALYLILATLSFYLVFDHRLMKHPLILKDQIKLEIKCACEAIPVMSVPTVAVFFAEVRGYSKLYNSASDNKFGWFGIVGSVVSFIFFTDMCIYWIHRFLHLKGVYKFLHKLHHKWKVPTPFASHAFHPIDGFLQSLPYHVYPFLFPLHKVTYLALFVFVNFWTVSIHDGDYRVPLLLKPFINGCAHHTDHHLFYNYNYGQFFTLWDHLGSSFRYPSAFDGCGPLEEVVKHRKKQQEQEQQQQQKQTGEEVTTETVKKEN
ncbi:lathosterol oxidase-like [Gigantopelta aegis]|uniref:lathosterol oxidase-like n=1 Tax=Gigantopelta aegis TaxID=1735272 RepID=UPI001B888631|nr:lathosterol oxidase-like [Gigantopelta aegis]XP_041373364.1 lathosterol oxidase-like [Gigantopelta aegis]